MVHLLFALVSFLKSKFFVSKIINFITIQDQSQKEWTTGISFSFLSGTLTPIFLLACDWQFCWPHGFDETGCPLKHIYPVVEHFYTKNSNYLASVNLSLACDKAIWVSGFGTSINLFLEWPLSYKFRAFLFYLIKRLKYFPSEVNVIHKSNTM